MRIVQQLLDIRRDQSSLSQHPVRHRPRTHRVHHLERPKLPVESRPHRGIDRDHIPRRLRLIRGDSIGRIRKQLRQKRPVERGRFVFLCITVQQLLQARRRVLHRLRQFERRQLRTRTRHVIERLPVQHVAQIAPLFVLARLFVEALPSLIAQPLLLKHCGHKRRHHRVRTLIVNPLRLRRKVHRHMRQHIHAHQVTQPECSRLRPTQRSPGQRIDLFNRQPLLHHQPDRVRHRKGANAVRDKIRRVARLHNRLPQPPVAERRHRFHVRRITRSRWDDLQQPHITRRIEEVRPKPVPLQILIQPRHNLRNRQPRGVRRRDRSWVAMLQHASQQRALDLQVLRHHLDHPVAPCDEREVVVEVAERNQPGRVSRIKRRRLRFFQPIHGAQNKLIPHGRRRIRSRTRRHHVQ